jgi:vacuolar-type H+-ATPase subunit H
LEAIDACHPTSGELNWNTPDGIGKALEVSGMETEGVGAGKAQTHGEAKKLLDEAWERAGKVYKEAKEQAELVYEDAKKLAVDKGARKRADEAYEEALKEAKKLHDAITNVAQAVFIDFWKQK